MIGRLLCGAGLTALVLVGLSRADGGTSGGGGGQIECAQWTLPVDITGLTFTAGPYPTKAEAIAASQDTQVFQTTVLDALWPGFACPGCPGAQPGCEEGLELVEAFDGTGGIRPGAGGWFVDWTANGGKFSASCSDCPSGGGTGGG